MNEPNQPKRPIGPQKPAGPNMQWVRLVHPDWEYTERLEDELTSNDPNYIIV